MRASNAPRPVTRPFALGDALILMIAISITFERLRSIHWLSSFPSSVALCWRMFSQIVGWSQWTLYIAYTRQALTKELCVHLISDVLLPTLCPALLGVMMAQPLLRLRRPRPLLGQVIRQSGFAVCMLGIALVCLLLPMGSWWFSGVALTLGLTRFMILIMIWPLLGLWPWHQEPSWVDRLGRGVGWGWIMAIALIGVLEYTGRI